MTYTSDDLMRILESLTPGGSEFHNSPKNCAEWVRGRLGTLSKVAGERNRLRAELETERELTHEALAQLAQAQLFARYARRHLTEADSDQAQNQAASYIDLIVPFDPDWHFGQELLDDAEAMRELEAHGLDIKGVPV